MRGADVTVGAAVAQLHLGAAGEVHVARLPGDRTGVPTAGWPTWEKTAWCGGCPDPE